MSWASSFCRKLIRKITIQVLYWEALGSSLNQYTALTTLPLNHKPHFDLSLMLKPTLSALNGPLGTGKKKPGRAITRPAANPTPT
jgi:hypothetical protein